MTKKHNTNFSIDESICFGNKGKVLIYNTIDRSTGDFHRILDCAIWFAKCGKTVVMTPKLDVPYKNPAYDMIYGSLKGTAYYGKCPDLIIDGVWYEHEGFKHLNPKTNFSNMCKRGFKQSDCIIIENCGLTDGYMLRSLEGQMKSGIKISEVWIHANNACRLLIKTEG
ncbi:MAG: hypothetical protein J6T13_01415 [Bacteroidales bacterium]|nr:hypothetical protein [Bacteroidales bacterium]